jgi:hypothetical protein
VSGSPGRSKTNTRHLPKKGSATTSERFLTHGRHPYFLTRGRHQSGLYKPEMRLEIPQVVGWSSPMDCEKNVLSTGADVKQKVSFFVDARG